MARKLITEDLLNRTPKGRAEYFDTRVRGLGVRQTVGGSAQFFTIYRAADPTKGKIVKRRCWIGDYPAMTPDDARAAVIDARKAVKAGRDPALEHRRQKAQAKTETPKTFQRAYDEYVAHYVATEHKNPEQTKAMFTTYVLPTWKDWRIAEITKADALTLLRRIVKDNGKFSANRVYATLRGMLNWCVRQDIIATSPLAGIDAPGGKEKARERVLEDPEVVAVWKAAETMGYPFAPLTQLLIATGQRRSEVAGMRWRDLRLDGDAPVWVIPKELTKSDRTHEVPLSPLAVSLIAACPKQTDADGKASPYVLTTRGDTPVSGFSKAKARLDEEAAKLAKAGKVAMIDEDFRLHDLRRTVVSGLAALKVPDIVISKVVNHAARGITQQVYNKHPYSDEKRDALARWANHLQAITEPKVASLADRRAAS